MDKDNNEYTIGLKIRCSRAEVVELVTYMNECLAKKYGPSYLDLNAAEDVEEISTGLNPVVFISCIAIVLSSVSIIINVVGRLAK